ncbi:MAG: ExbD/TolR family protein [Puniceicoccales bacterium]
MPKSPPPSILIHGTLHASGVFFFLPFFPEMNFLKVVVRMRKKQDEPEAFQMAPMIDMVFLLLVFFMTVSNLAQAEKRIKLDLPESAEADVPKELSDRTAVSIKANGKIYWGAREISPEDLPGRLEPLVVATPDLRVQVRADQDTPFLEIKKVLQACAQAGAYNVIYSTYQSN